MPDILKVKIGISMKKFEHMNEQEREELSRKTCLDDANETLVSLNRVALAGTWSDLSSEENIQQVIRWLNHGSHHGRIG